MKLQKLKLLSFLAVSVFFTIPLAQNVTAQDKSKGLLSEKILESLNRRDKGIPIFRSESDNIKILFGLIEPANRYIVYNLPADTFKKLTKAKFSYKTIFSIKSTDSSITLISENRKFELGKIISEGKLEKLDRELNSFKYASVNSNQFSLVQIGNADRVVALAIVTNDNEVAKEIRKNDKSLFFTSQNELSTLVYSEARLSIFKYSTASFEQLRKLSSKLSTEEALNAISELGSNIGYWRKYLAHDEIKVQELQVQSELLISTLVNFAELYANQALRESEINDLINYLHSLYPKYYELLNQVYSPKRNKESIMKDKVVKNKSSLRKSQTKKSPSKNNKSKVQPLSARSAQLNGQITVIKKTPVVDPIIAFKALVLPDFAKVSSNYNIVTPCKEERITHPYQSSSVLGSVNCNGGVQLNIDAGPIPMVYNSRDRESNFLGVPGLMPAFAAKITADLKFYIDAYSKRSLFKASATVLAESLKFWSEGYKYIIVDANTIHLKTDEYTKVFRKLPNASSPDFFISQVLNKQGGALVGYHYDRITLNPVRISFRNNLNSSKLDTISIVQTGSIVKFNSSLPASEYTPVTIKLKTDNAIPLDYPQDTAIFLVDPKTKILTPYVRDPKTGRFYLDKPLPISKMFSTIEYIKDRGNFTTFAWGRDPASINLRSSNNDPRTYVTGITKKVVQESIVRYSDGHQGRQREEKEEYSYYFGLNQDGIVTQKGSGKFEQPIETKVPMFWEKLNYTKNAISLTNKFKQSASVSYLKYGLYTLVSKFKKYNGLGIETNVYGTAAEGYRLDKTIHPAYGVTFDLIRQVDTENYKLAEYLTRKGKELHTQTRSGNRTGTESIYYDKRNVEILRTKHVVSKDGKYTLLETIVGNKRTTIEESGPKKTEIVRIANKIVKHITRTENATTTTTVNELDDTSYQESSTESGGILKSTTTVNIPGYPSLTRKSEIAVAGDNYTATEKNYVGASIVKNYRETISNGEYQIRNEYPMPGSANWLSEINGATDNNKKPFSSLSIIPAQ